jgi:hypothetical protein
MFIGSPSVVRGQINSHNIGHVLWTSHWNYRRISNEGRMR